MVKPAGKRTSKGRQRIEIRFIECKEQRQVAFSKRRSGLFKKASELATKTGAVVAVVAFSEAGRAFAFGSPSVDSVLLGEGEREGAPVIVGGGDPAEDHEAMRLRLAAEETREQVAADKERMDVIGKKVMEAAARRRFWWEADVGLLGVAELPEFTRALQRLKDTVGRHLHKQAGVAPLLQQEAFFCSIG